MNVELGAVGGISCQCLRRRSHSSSVIITVRVHQNGLCWGDVVECAHMSSEESILWEECLALLVFYMMLYVQTDERCSA